MNKKEQRICALCNITATIKDLLTEFALTIDSKDKRMLLYNPCEILTLNTERTYISLLELLNETNLV